MTTTTPRPGELRRLPTRPVRVRLDHPVVRFLIVGSLSTAAYVLLYVALREPLGAGGANALALAATAVANTHANRAFTFGIRGRRALARQHLAGALVYLLALGLTAGSLSALHRADPHPTRAVEITVLVLASAVATLTRYVALRSWVFVGNPPAEVRANTVDRGRARI